MYVFKVYICTPVEITKNIFLIYVHNYYNDTNYSTQ